MPIVRALGVLMMRCKRDTRQIDKIFNVLLLSLLSLYGCGSEYTVVNGELQVTSVPNQEAHQNGQANLVTIVGEVFLDSSVLRRPMRMAVQGNHLLIIDRDPEAPLKISNRLRPYDLVGFQVYDSLSRTQLAPSAIGVTDQPACCEAWILEAPHQRVSLLTGQPGRDLSIVRRIRLAFDGPALMSVPLTDGYFVVTGVFDTSHRYAIANSRGSPDKWAGQLPFLVDEIPLYVQQHAFQGTVARRPSHDDFVIVARHSSAIQIVLESQRTILARTPVTFYPTYGVQEFGSSDVFTIEESTVFGYVDVAATSDYILALYSGKRFGDNPSGAHLATEVHLFDWEGNLLRRARLDHPALTIASTPTIDMLYTTRRGAVAVMLYRSETLSKLLP
jgi:hypothetical protein